MSAYFYSYYCLLPRRPALSHTAITAILRGCAIALEYHPNSSIFSSCQNQDNGRLTEDSSMEQKTSSLGSPGFLSGFLLPSPHKDNVNEKSHEKDETRWLLAMLTIPDRGKGAHLYNAVTTLCARAYKEQETHHNTWNG